jgi:hypothetical protein
MHKIKNYLIGFWCTKILGKNSVIVLGKIVSFGHGGGCMPISPAIIMRKAHG